VIKKDNLEIRVGTPPPPEIPLHLLEFLDLPLETVELLHLVALGFLDFLEHSNLLDIFESFNWVRGWGGLKDGLLLGYCGRSCVNDYGSQRCPYC